MKQNTDQDLRYEVKMVFDELRIDEMRSWILSHSDVFRCNYPPRQINNIYFDTINRDLVLDHIDGVPNRAKVRFRWYGNTTYLQNGQIEIKAKNGRLGYKIIQLISTDLDLSESSWHEIIGTIKNKSNNDIAWLFSELQPTSINHYNREYYISMDGLIRITLDYNMSTYEQTFGFLPNFNYKRPLQKNVIIEFKTAKIHYARLANSLAEFPLYCTQYSKYLNGMENAI